MSIQQESPPPVITPSALALQVGVASFGRILLNTARRFPYPFAPALSRGLGTPLAAITSLIAANQITGVLSLILGPLGDRWGYRTMLLLGLGLMGVGMLTGGLLPNFALILVALFLAGLGKSMFDPALQAYVGERVPYRRRGMVIGLMETAWAGSSLIGIPLIGFLMAGFGWRTPFLVLGGLSLVTTGVLVILLHPGDRPSTDLNVFISIRTAWQRLVRERSAMGMLGFAFLISVANDNFFVTYGAWLEEAFSMSIVGLGITTSIIGVAELLGETLTASLGDRLGLSRSILIGGILSALSYLLLPLAGLTLPFALIALFLIFLFVEFAVVAALSLSTEVLPSARATMMSGFLAAASMGRVLGALTGGYIWTAGGIVATGVVSAIVSIMAMASFWWGLRGWRAGRCR